MIRGHLRPLNPKPEWEIRQVYPIRAFSLSKPHLTPSDIKLLLIARFAKLPYRTTLTLNYVIARLPIVGIFAECCICNLILQNPQVTPPIYRYQISTTLTLNLLPQPYLRAKLYREPILRDRLFFIVNSTMYRIATKS